jgi:cytochrome c553
MKKTQIVLIAIVLFTLAMVQSCEKGNNATRISQNGGHSHNAGRNCMGCHYSGGEGSGWFNVAGTVYDNTKTTSYPNTTVYLSTLPNGRGTIVDTLYGDGSGNFYTTASINFGTGLYPSVAGTNGGGVSHMSTSITTGACNSCHGVSTDKLWAN